MIHLLRRLALQACLLFTLVVPRAEAVQIRVGAFNILQGFGEPGTTSYDAARDVIRRVDADIIGFSEARGPDKANFDTMAAELGYPHTAYSTSSSLDTSNRTAFMSRWPILSIEEVPSPPGAVEMTRQNIVVTVDVPGTTNDPTLVSVHYKCCATTNADPFRRAVEIRRTIEFLQSKGLDGSDNVFVVGDYNLVGSTTTITSLPSGLPTKYTPGDDLTFPIDYTTNPDSYFPAIGLAKVPMRQADGVSSSTYVRGGILDYIVTSTAVSNRGFATEIYNSAREANHPGLAKAGDPLASARSSEASDHFMIFGDFELEDADAPPALVLIASPTSVPESAPANSVELVVRIPQAPSAGESVTVNLASGDTSEFIVDSPVVTFLEGETAIAVTGSTVNDGEVDGGQIVVVTASAEGFTTAAAELLVTDVGGGTTVGRSLEGIGQSITDGFDGFTGTVDPQDWTVTNAPDVAPSVWLGMDEGQPAGFGKVSYGTGMDGSLGFRPGGSQRIVASTTFTNNTGTDLKTIGISYDAEQWFSSPAGLLNGWQVELVVGGTVLTLEDLAFTASNTLPAGMVPGGDPTTLSASIDNLAIAEGESFTVRFTSTSPESTAPNTEEWIATTAHTKGAVNTGQDFTAKAGMWINEFHYDNEGTDEGEFIEVVVAPGYPLVADAAAVVLYNGGDGAAYATHTLDTFVETTTASGHRILHKDLRTNGIQNGPDGIALVAGETVVEFLSYEGSLTATEGPAVGMFSKDVGAFQANSASHPVGSSIQLTGEVTAASQGIAIDNLTVVAEAAVDPDLPPSIGTLEPQSIDEDGALEILFTVADEDTLVSEVATTATSSNQNLVADDAITVSGTGRTRSLLLTPRPDANGSAVITLAATDGRSTTTNSFELTVLPVNDEPVLGSIPDITIGSGETSGAATFTVADPDSTEFVLSATSSNTDLLPSGNILFSGSGENRTVAVETVPGRSGWSVVEVVLSDGQASTSLTFTVSVARPPTLGTFAAAGLPLDIADADGNTPTVTTATLEVSGENTILDVDVLLSLAHTYARDVEMVLVHPDGTRVQLVNRRGGSRNNFTGTVFDDSAEQPVTSGSPPFTGSFRPESPLNALVGKAAAGTWELRITDHERGDTGTLNAWELRISMPGLDSSPPVISINGDSTVVLNQGDTYTELGASASDETDGPLTVTVDGTVDTSVPGTSVVTYTATDTAGNVATASRSIEVRDVTPPDISLIGANPLAVEAGSEFTDPGATAFDAVDGALPALPDVVVDPSVTGSFTITYTAVDNSGNSASVSRGVVVADTTPPVVTLAGEAEILVPLGTPFVDPGAGALDSFDGPLPATASAQVDTSVPGQQTITYLAIDSAGNTGSAARTVEIVDLTPPAISLAGDDPLFLLVGETFEDPGSTAVDNVDGMVAVTVSGAVEPSTPGDYLLTYSAVDAAGNTATATRTVRVVDPSTAQRVFTASLTTLVDSFDGFDGLSDPPGWSTTDAANAAVSAWLGTNTGTSTSGGKYSYGVDGDGSLGFLPSSSRAVVAEAVFLNRAGRAIVGLDIAYDGEHWRAVLGGRLNGWTVEIGIDGVFTELPDLEFIPANDLPTGAVENGLTSTLSTSLADLAIPHGSQFTIRFIGSNSGSGGSGSRQGTSIDNLAITATLEAPLDATPPVITLSGPDPVILPVGGTYLEPGATVADGVDPSPTLSIEGSIDTSTPGNGTITYLATDASGNAATTTRTVEVVAAMTYELDVVRGLTGAEGDPLADPDQDGRPNLLEYALGGDPTVPDSPSPQPEFSMNGTTFSLTAAIRDDPALEVVAQFRGNLATDDWRSTGILEVPIDQSGTPEGHTRRRWTIDRSGNSTGFLRLIVTHP
jgi:subtilisin-like proprotein convertase family protein